MMDKLGLYIHIPFCVKKCNYCDFCSFDNAAGEKSRYIDAVICEMKAYKDKTNGRIFDTVYIGGGTPSVLPPDEILKLGHAIKDIFNIEENAEFTFETNPQSGIKDVLLAAKEIGVNRLSIGLQSSHDDELTILGRSHTKSRFSECYHTAREIGFENISIDIMTALPGQTMDRLISTAKYITDLAPEHISAYTLKIEEGTPFYKIRDTLDLPDEDLQSEMYLKLTDYLENCGYNQYEISNYAREGYHSRHNTRYWQAREYIGIGVSAHSYFEGARYSNTNSLNAYIESAKEGIFSYEDKVVLSECDLIEEYIMLSLRLKTGLDFSVFESKFGFDLKDKIKEKLELFKKNGTYNRRKR